MRYWQELDKAFTLAWEAFHSTSVPRIRSESCYHIARTHHIKGDFEQAGKFYEHATTIQSDFMLPHIGLGQAHFHAKKWAEAKACFDRVLRLHPNSFDVRKMIGCVCARSGESEKALEHFEFIASREQEDQVSIPRLRTPASSTPKSMFLSG